MKRPSLRSIVRDGSLAAVEVRFAVGIAHACMVVAQGVVSLAGPPATAAESGGGRFVAGIADRAAWTRRSTQRIIHDAAVIETLRVVLLVDPHRRAPREIVLNLDATDDPLQGQQEGWFFHGDYDTYCCPPLYVSCGRHLLAAELPGLDKRATHQFATASGYPHVGLDHAQSRSVLALVHNKLISGILPQTLGPSLRVSESIASREASLRNPG